VRHDSKILWSRDRGSAHYFLNAKEMRMPFDGTQFELPPKPRKPNLARERVLSALVFAFAVLMLILPVSADALIDIVAYLRGP
jgi:hypothetical protein